MFDYWSLRSKNYEDSGENPCLLCGKEVKKLGQGVIVNEGGDLLLTPEEAKSDPNHSFFSVGPECIRKIPTAYRV